MRAAPLPGVALDGGTVTASRHPSIAPGDELVAVDGVRGYEFRLVALLSEIPAGAEVPITFNRRGLEISLLIDTRPLDDLHAIALWVRVLCAVACLLVGVVSFVLTPGSRAAWLFLLFCVNLEITLGFNVLFAGDPIVFLRLEPITFALGASIGLHLFTELPKRLPLLRRRPLAALLIYVPALPLVALGATQPPPPEGMLWGWL